MSVVAVQPAAEKVAPMLAAVEAGAALSRNEPASAGEIPAPPDKSRRLKRELVRAALGALLLLLLRVFVLLGGGFTAQEGLSYLIALLSIHISIVVVAFGAASLFEEAWSDLRARHFGPAGCESVALLTLLGTQTYALFYEIEELLALPLYSSVPVVTAMLAAVRALDHSALAALRARVGMSLAELAPRMRLFSADEPAAEKWLPARLAQVGDIFLVRSGEIVPLDAEIVAGKAEIVEHRFGGGPVRRFKSAGQGVFAGSVLRAGELRCRSLSCQDEAVYEGFLAGVRQSVGKSLNEDLSRRLALGISLGLVFLAACSVLFWNERGAPLTQIGLIVSAVALGGLLPRMLQLLSVLSSLVLTSLFVRGATLKDADVIQRLAYLKNLVLDYESVASARHLQVLRFEVIDGRIDQKSLVSALLALLGDGDDEFSGEAVRALREKVDEPHLFELTGYHYYAGKGILGGVQGADFSVGSEAFLIERGVQLEPADVAVLKEGEDVVYVAIGEEVVARFIIRPTSRAEEREVLEALSRLKVRTLLCGPEPAEHVDALAKEIGIELPSSYGGLSGEVYKEKVLGWKPVGFYSRIPPSPAVSNLVDVSLSHFDELRWNDRVTDVTLFDPGLRLLGTVVRVCRSAERLRRGLLVSAVALALVIHFAAFVALFPPALVLVTLAAGCAAGALLLLSFVR